MGNGLPVEMDERFPSGEWVGFFIQPSMSQAKRQMDLYLRFAGGVLEGEGQDGVGDFTISGHYDTASGEVTFQKQYVGKHGVHYRGWNERNGIWGTWEIRQRILMLSFKDRGGFHIWPKGEADATVESLEEEAPVLVDD